MDEETPDLIEAMGKASEAFECVERARGHLYSFHQLMGRADRLFGEAADLLAGADQPSAGTRLADEVVGRNVLDGRWTYQVVDEFDLLYYDPVRALVRGLEDELLGGRRHLLEARMKEARRSRGRAGHEALPRSAHDERIETQP